ncbi:hypothetical protein N752_28770 [Desulforamulus aquiferis]|nr:FeoA family protein [Desulforamulus aquiferis]RYD01571.1 hypothetical protein N752_28770 [Desulforamulus aquiferis]
MVKTLGQMRPGEIGTVLAVNGKGQVHRRLIDMGVVPGVSVEVKKFAPLGDPIEIKIRVITY